MGNISLSDFAENSGEETSWKKEVEPATTETVDAATDPATTETVNSDNTTIAPTEPESPNLVITTNTQNGPEASTNPNTLLLPASNETTTNDILNSLLGQIGDIGETTYLKIMIYGDPGSGKSSFTATAPNNLIYDLEDGLVAAKQSPNGIANGVQAIPFQSWDQSRALLTTLSQRPPELDKFEVFSIDTLSELHKRGLAEVTEREYRKRPTSSNRYVAETEHHTENNERIVRFFRALRDLDRHLIVIAHSRTVEPKNKPAKTFPDFSESLANKIMAFMDVVGYSEMRKVDGETVPVVRFISNGTIAAKNRIGLPEEVANPTFTQIKELWEKNK